MIQVTEKQDVEPLCAHCSSPLTELWFRKLQSTFGNRYVYFCPGCRKVLGISHRKGLFMG